MLCHLLSQKLWEPKISQAGRIDEDAILHWCGRFDWVEKWERKREVYNKLVYSNCHELISHLYTWWVEYHVIRETRKENFERVGVVVPERYTTTLQVTCQICDVCL